MLTRSDSIPHYVPPAGRSIQNGILQIAETAHRLHGDLVWISASASPLLLLAGARHICQLVEQESVFLKDFASPTSASAVGRIIMGPALTTSLDGEEWRLARKLTTPTVNPKLPLLKESAARSARWLTATLSQGSGHSLRALCLDWALMCVAEGFFGRDIGLSRLNSMIAHFRRIYLELIVAAPHMEYAQMCRHPALVQFREEVETLLAPHLNRVSDGPATMLQRLCLALDVNASSEERDRVISLLLGNLAASVDNTGIALLWTLTHLAQQGNYQSQIRQEAAQGKRTTALAVVKEALRLTPVTAFFERKTAQEIVTDGVAIPAGTQVLFSPWLIHRNPAYWPEPLTFDPQRFLQETKIPNGHFIPFSVGKRNCVGMTLALDQLTTAVTTLCSDFTFSLAPDTRPAALKPLFELNVMPRGDIHLIFQHHNKVSLNVC